MAGYLTSPAVMGEQHKYTDALEDVMNKRLALVSLVIFTFVVSLVLFAEQGVVATDSGLAYEDVETGTGAAAEKGKTVVIHVTGWLDDQGQKGVKFISSRDLGEAIAFKVGTQKVIQGWNLGVTGMKVGGKRRLMIPAELAYGAEGVDGVVPPNADLIFEVELLDVK